MTKDKKRAWISGVVATVFVVAVLAGVMALAGCAARVTTVTGLPANVTQQQAQQWDTAVASLHKIAVTTSSLRQAVVALNEQGVFPDGMAYANTLHSIAKIDQLQLAASTLLRQAPQNFGAPVKTQITGYLQQISTEITALNQQGVTGIKNPASQQQVAGLISEITSAAALVLAL
jgi:hypothetical protein